MQNEKSSKSDHKLQSYANAAVAEGLERIRNHPFITSANSRLLSREQALRWIKCAGRESRSFPQIIERMIKRTSNERIRKILQENLNDEYGNGNPEEAHFNHYLQLLDSLGIPRDNFYNYPEKAGIQLALSLAYNVASQPNNAIALGYTLVNEEMTQITYSAIKNGLSPHYPALKTRFFDLHVDVDAEHVEGLFEAVDELDSNQKEAVLFGIAIGERGMAVLLDEALGIFEHSPETEYETVAGSSK